MKTAEDLNRLIRDEIATIEALRSEDEKIWSVRGGGNRGRCKTQQEDPPHDRRPQQRDRPLAPPDLSELVLGIYI